MNVKQANMKLVEFGYKSRNCANSDNPIGEAIAEGYGCRDEEQHTDTLTDYTIEAGSRYWLVNCEWPDGQEPHEVDCELVEDAKSTYENCDTQEYRIVNENGWMYEAQAKKLKDGRWAYVDEDSGYKILDSIDDSTLLYVGYVKDETGSVFVQVWDDNEWGFSICDDDQTWAGGFGLGSNWWPIDESDVSEEDKDRLSWLLP